MWWLLRNLLDELQVALILRHLRRQAPASRATVQRH